MRELFQYSYGEGKLLVRFDKAGLNEKGEKHGCLITYEISDEDEEKAITLNKLRESAGNRLGEMLKEKGVITEIDLPSYGFKPEWAK